MVMNRTGIFLAMALSCAFTTHFFAAEKMELATIIKPLFIPLTEGLQTLVPKILVKWKYHGVKTIDKILPSDQLWTLKGLMEFNYCDGSGSLHGELFLPTIIKVNEDTSIVKARCFDSKFNCPKTMESCRQEKAVFYSYKQGALISFLERPAIDIELLKLNEAALQKMIDENAQEELMLRVPVIKDIK
jgi:hypothetical protein